MLMHEQLLDQAEHLATRDQGRPQQVNLRRAISAGYYAMFHFLIHEATRFIIPNHQRDLRHLMARCYHHREMKEAAKIFSRGSLPLHLSSITGGPPSQDLKAFAQTFVEAQERRHLADYDLRTNFVRQNVLAFIHRIRQALNRWNHIAQNDPQTISVFLLCLLTWDRLRKRF